MAVPEPGCCDGPNDLLRKILIGLAEIGGTDSVGNSFLTLDDMVLTDTSIHQLASSSSPRGVRVSSHPDNSGYIYITSSNGVRPPVPGNAAGAAKSGVPITAAGSFVFNVDNSNELFVISDTANNRICIQIL